MYKETGAHEQRKSIITFTLTNVPPQMPRWISLSPGEKWVCPLWETIVCWKRSALEAMRQCTRLLRRYVKYFGFFLLAFKKIQVRFVRDPRTIRHRSFICCAKGDTIHMAFAYTYYTQCFLSCIFFSPYNLSEGKRVIVGNSMCLHRVACRVGLAFPRALNFKVHWNNYVESSK